MVYRAAPRSRRRRGRIFRRWKASSLPSGKQLRKLSPLADWHTRDVWQYAERYAIPLLPLYDLGYSSIGCEPCTSLPASADDPRSGRWGGAKVECGIHIQPGESH